MIVSAGRMLMARPSGWRARPLPSPLQSLLPSSVQSTVNSNTGGSVRLFSDDKGGSGDKDGKPKDDVDPISDPFLISSNPDESDDPFGLEFEDGPENLGPSRPPDYVRDRATGKMTGDVRDELTAAESRLLTMTDTEQQQLLTDRVVDEWHTSLAEAEHDESKVSMQERVTDKIRLQEAALNTIGRSGAAVDVRKKSDDDEEDDEDESNEYRDESGWSHPLSKGEFRSLQRYAKYRSNGELELTEADIPVQKGSDVEERSDADNADLDLKWLTRSAKEDYDPDDPFADLMPSDLNPARLVNRQRAKHIPRHLLHHNNLTLLRRYTTPDGLIMNRVQSRLGARDQRKIAKLVKRARALGLIPHTGQWRVENHGNKYEKNINEDLEWEKELKERGLVVGGTDDDKSPWMKKDK